MDNAELYAVYNSMQRRSTEAVLAEFTPRLSWAENEKVLDVGCGPGDVTAQVLLPRLPSCASLVGIDVSSAMVDYANKTYSSEKVTFTTLDFGIQNITDSFKMAEFSKIFSFFCLHWIQDQKQVAENIRILLHPGGEFLIIVAPSNQIFLVYKILSQMDKWKSYMKDVDKYIPCFNGSADPCEELSEVFRRQGLEVLLCEEKKETISFPSMQVLMRSNEAVNPFVKRMSAETRKQYMACFQQVVEEHRLCTETDSGGVETKNPLIILHGRRPESIHS